MKNLLLTGLIQRVSALAAADDLPLFRGLIHSQIDAVAAPFAVPANDVLAGLTIVQKKPVRGQRNLTMRIHPKTGAVELRAPRRTSKSEIRAFIESHRDWLRQRLTELDPAIPLVAGTTIPFMGQPRLVVADRARKRGVRDNGTELLVGVGDAIDEAMAASLLPKRLKSFLVARAKREVTMRAKFYGAQVGKRIASVAVRDVHARWGSCSTGGCLSFSWRLVLTPIFVLDYVVAHECAHLVHMDHSAAFWKQVEQLIGDYEIAEQWLDQQGPAIIRIG